jgi:hypothetical protein
VMPMVLGVPLRGLREGQRDEFEPVTHGEPCSGR